MTELLERASRYEELMKEDGLLVLLQELQNVEKEILLVFMVDKCSRKIYRSGKDTVIKSLMVLRLKHQRIIRGKGYFMQDVLVRTPVNCEDASSRNHFTKDLIIRTDY